MAPKFKLLVRQNIWPNGQKCHYKHEMSSVTEGICLSPWSYYVFYYQIDAMIITARVCILYSVYADAFCYFVFF